MDFHKSRRRLVVSIKHRILRRYVSTSRKARAKYSRVYYGRFRRSGLYNGGSKNRIWQRRLPHPGEQSRREFLRCINVEEDAGTSRIWKGRLAFREDWARAGLLKQASKSCAQDGCPVFFFIDPFGTMGWSSIR